MAESANPIIATDAGRLLAPYLDAYIAGRTDCKPGTVTNFKQSRRLLVEHFGHAKPLSTITHADAERWHRWLITDKKHSEATVSKHTKRAKTMFAAAVKDRLLSPSPFAILKGGKEANHERHHFLTPEVSADVLEACPNHDWRLIFGLSRYCRMRCPSKVLNLRWFDVLWIRTEFVSTVPKRDCVSTQSFPKFAQSLKGHSVTIGGKVTNTSSVDTGTVTTLEQP